MIFRSKMYVPLLILEKNYNFSYFMLFIYFLSIYLFFNFLIFFFFFYILKKKFSVLHL